MVSTLVERKGASQVRQPKKKPLLTVVLQPSHHVKHQEDASITDNGGHPKSKGGTKSKRHTYVETRHMEGCQRISTVRAAKVRNTRKNPRAYKQATVKNARSRTAQINRAMRDQQKTKRKAVQSISQVSLKYIADQGSQHMQRLAPLEL